MNAPAPPTGRSHRSLLGRLVTNIGVAFVAVELVVLAVFTVFYWSSLVEDREDHLLRYATGVRSHVLAALQSPPEAGEQVDEDLDAALTGEGGQAPEDAQRPFIPPTGAPVSVWVFTEGQARKFTRTGRLLSPEESGTWDPKNWPPQVRQLMHGERVEVPVERSFTRLVRFEPLASGSAKPPLPVLYVEGSLRGLNHQVATYGLIAFGTGSLALVFAAMVTMGFLRRSLLLPLARMIEADNAARRGDTTNALVDVGDIPDDEVGAIMRSRNNLFNAMAVARRDVDAKNKELEKQRGELRVWGRELEQLVQDKTAALLHAREILHRTEKLAALGRLAANVAHEINNPLASIAGYAEAAQSDLDADDREEVAQALKTIEDQAFRCKDILKRLLGLARTDELTLAPVQLGRLVRESVALGEHSRDKRGVELELELPAGDGPTVSSDATSVQQVILNLVENAIDAALLGDGTPHVWVSLEGIDTGEVALIVRDNGRGIPEAAQARVFDPFYTTKPVGRGTGLGLAICQSLIERLGGTIAVESREGEGATFTVFLPRQPRRPTRPLTASPDTGIADGSSLVEAQLRIASGASDPDGLP